MIIVNRWENVGKELPNVERRSYYIMQNKAKYIHNQVRHHRVYIIFFETKTT